MLAALRSRQRLARRLRLSRGARDSLRHEAVNDEGAHQAQQTTQQKRQLERVDRHGASQCAPSAMPKPNPIAIMPICWPSPPVFDMLAAKAKPGAAMAAEARPCTAVRADSCSVVAVKPSKAVVGATRIKPRMMGGLRPMRSDRRPSGS